MSDLLSQQIPLDRDPTITQSVQQTTCSATGKKITKKKQYPDSPSMMIKDNSTDVSSDVSLVGDDGVPIPAIRRVLSSASPVLKELLYIITTACSDSKSNSSASLTTKDSKGLVIRVEPQKSPMVHIPGFRRETIQALVEYCCSDSDLRQTSLFKSIFHPTANHRGTRSKRKNNEANLVPTCRDPAQAVIDMLDFAQLAINYEIPKVPQELVNLVAPLTKKYPPLACVVVNYLLTVEFPVLPSQQTQDSSTKLDGSPSLIPQCNTSKSSKEAKDAEKVISAAAALTKLYTTALNIIRTQPYVALEPWIMSPESSDTSASSTCSIPSDEGSDHKIVVGGVLTLHATTFEKILQDTEVECDELFLFRQIQCWHDYHYPHHHQHKGKQSQPLQQQHKITNTLHRKINGIASSISNGDDDDSFQFRANFNEFMATNEPRKCSSPTGDTLAPHSDDTHRYCKDDSENQWKLITAGQTARAPGSATKAGQTSSWGEHNQSSAAPRWASTSDDEYSCPDPTSVCRNLVRHLDLAAIDPLPLKQIVSKASFVDAKLVIEALWQQVTLASEQGGLSFGAVVRGSGGPGPGLVGFPGDLDDLTSCAGTTTCISTQKGPPEHQYFKSHILVHGAGVEDCNGIYTQVVTKDDEEDQNDKNGSWEEVPTIMCRSSSETTATLEMSYTKGLQPALPPCQVSGIPTGICLRFVKHNKRKSHHKGKTCYLVCRREIVDESARFHHQWSIIEEDDSRDGGQLRVLYEWEPDYDPSYLSQATLQTRPTPLVLDSSVLQTFPESGWTCVQGEYHPTPNLKWFRPRHGSPLLVVPPAKPLKHKGLTRMKPAANAKVPIPQTPPPPLVVTPRPEKTSRGVKPGDSLCLLSSTMISDPPRNHKATTTVTRRDKGQSTIGETSVGMNTIDNDTSMTATSSSFQLQKARTRRVSLADDNSSSMMMTFEI